MPFRLRSIVATLLLTLGVARCPASIDAPVGYSQVVTERTKQALVFFDGEYAHLIIGTSLESSGALPPTMAWVIPLPSVPARYSDASLGLFDELYDHTQDAAKPPTSGLASGVSATEPGIRVHPAEHVGAYVVQPIEIVRPNSGKDLNAWLQDNGFHAVPVQNQRYYLKPGACFLSVKVSGLSGSETTLSPLHIVYRADRLTLPLKFSTHSGDFNVLLYSFTPHEMQRDTLAAYRLTNGESVAIDWPWQAPELWKATGGRKGYLTRFTGVGFNEPDSRVASLTEDPSLDAEPVELQSLAPLWGAGAGLCLLVIGLILRSYLKRRPKRIPPERQAIAITRNEEYIESAPPEEKTADDEEVWISLRRPGDDE